MGGRTQTAAEIEAFDAVEDAARTVQFWASCSDYEQMMEAVRRMNERISRLEKVLLGR